MQSMDASKRDRLIHSFAVEKEEMHSASHEKNTITNFVSDIQMNNLPSNRKRLTFSVFVGQETTAPIRVTISYRMHRLF